MLDSQLNKYLILETLEAEFTVPDQDCGAGGAITCTFSAIQQNATIRVNLRIVSVNMGKDGHNNRTSISQVLKSVMIAEREIRKQ